jgi:hypothetical protein
VDDIERDVNVNHFDSTPKHLGVNIYALIVDIESVTRYIDLHT